MLNSSNQTNNETNSSNDNSNIILSVLDFKHNKSLGLFSSKVISSIIDNASRDLNESDP